MTIELPSPVSHYEATVADAVAKTPAPFDGIWFHTTSAKAAILQHGWNPDLLKGTIYGTAVYLARRRWTLRSGDLDIANPNESVPVESYLKSPTMIGCVLALEAHEVQSCFPTEAAPRGNAGR